MRTESHFKVYFKDVDWFLKPKNKTFAHSEFPPVYFDQFGVKVYCDRLEIKIFLKQHLQNSSISFKFNLPIKEYALTMQTKLKYCLKLTTCSMG